MEPHAARLMTALTNVVLAMNGEPELRPTDELMAIADKLDLIATKLRLARQQGD
jgi:hypothetical protein